VEHVEVEKHRERAGSFEDFYEHEYRAVVGLAYVLSGAAGAAEDIAQEAFIAAHRSWDRISRYDQPGAWVRRVASNIAASTVRRRFAEARALARLGRHATQIDQLPEPAEEFWRAVRALPKRQAQAVALHYLEDLPLAEVARILECAEGTVKAHLYKARAKLATTLEVDE